MSELSLRSYAAGHFELQFDSKMSTAYVKSVEGGTINHNTVSERVGTTNLQIKHSSVATIEPITLEVGLAGSEDILRWCQDGWKKKFSRRSGQIDHGDINLVRVHEQHFKQALINEVTFPTLDKHTGKDATIKFKFTPEDVMSKDVKNGPRLGVGATLESAQKLWAATQFQLVIDGDKLASETSRIEGFTIKHGVKPYYAGNAGTGAKRLPMIQPTNIEFPNLVCTISAAFGGGIQAWYDRYVHKGQNSQQAQRTGALEFLSPTGKVLFSITLMQLGLAKAPVLQSTANQDGLKRMKFELYCGSMEFDGFGSGFR